MRRAVNPAVVALGVAGLALGVALMVLWLTGGLAGLERWAAASQREAQTTMAASLRALRAGQPGAVAGLMAVCFAYGFFHAVGPGHGKVLIGAYGFGAQVPLGRLAAISVAASLAQAGVAVALVWGGITALDLTRAHLTALTEDHMARISAAMIGAVGLWLAWRGLRAMRVAARAGGGGAAGAAGGCDHNGAAPGDGAVCDHKHHAHHDHHHDHPDDACGCGHAHGPTPDQIAQTRGLWDGVVLVAAIAARPCSGALFVLILTWRMGIFPAGVAGAFAMGLGTASVTLAVAVLSVWARRGGLGLVAQAGPWAVLGRWAPAVMQLAAGLLVAIIAARLLT